MLFLELCQLVWLSLFGESTTQRLVHLNGLGTLRANVLHGGHFVLVVGWDANDEDTLYINDSGFWTIKYSLSRDVVGWRLYRMSDKA